MKLEEALDAIRHEVSMLKDGQRLTVECINRDDALYTILLEFPTWPRPFLRGPKS